MTIRKAFVRSVHAGAEAFIQDALQVFDLFLVGRRVVVVGGLVEEVGRRQLLRIADHHQLPAAGDGAHAVHRLLGQGLPAELIDEDVAGLAGLAWPRVRQHE
jgi:hypothetical protein